MSGGHDEGTPVTLRRGWRELSLKSSLVTFNADVMVLILFPPTNMRGARLLEQAGLYGVIRYTEYYTLEKP